MPAFSIKRVAFSFSGFVSKLIHTYITKEVIIPISACSTEAISHAEGNFVPKAISMLYVENTSPNIIDAKAPLELPAFQINAKTNGTKAPVAKKSEPIQAMRKIERISKLISNPKKATIAVDIFPTKTI